MTLDVGKIDLETFINVLQLLVLVVGLALMLWRGGMQHARVIVTLERVEHVLEVHTQSDERRFEEGDKAAAHLAERVAALEAVCRSRA